MNRLPVQLSVMFLMLTALTACGRYELEEVGTRTPALGTLSYTNIGSAMGTPVITGDTCGAANEVLPACGSSNASDLSYLWTAPYGGPFELTTGATRLDTILHVTSDDGATLLGCNDNVSPSDPSSRVVVSVAAGQKILITVDGAGTGCGSFQLNIKNATCSASLTCPGGQTVSCTGPAGTCSTTQHSVICDGSGYMCPCAVPCSTHSICDQYCGTPGNGYCMTSCNKKHCTCLL